MSAKLRNNKSLTFSWVKKKSSSWNLTLFCSLYHFVGEEQSTWSDNSDSDPSNISSDDAMAQVMSFCI